MNYICAVCGNAQGNKVYDCSEKMFGWGGHFPYFQCAVCGCLQIAETPVDLARYYPANYYSFRKRDVPQTGWKAHLAGLRDYSVATGGGALGKILGWLAPAGEDIGALSAIPASPGDRILDVGCGQGELLARLHRAGFRNLTGVDPYLERDAEPVPSVKIRKASLSQIEGEFDIIMLHHVFEHLPSGTELLRDARARLAKGGVIVLRFPTPESDAWETYRENWVQLDAPRHLYLHTRQSLALLAQAAGLKIKKQWCDSWGFQFFGSELYQKGLTLSQEDGSPHAFSKPALRKYAKRAQNANVQNRGDQLCALLERAT